MASTWLTLDTVRQEQVILKILHEDIVRDAGGFGGLKETLRFTSSFRHQSVLSVFDFSESENQVYFSMETARGESVRDRIDAADKSGQPIDARTIGKIMSTLLNTIAEGRTNTFPHGGIKPENIWMEPNDRVRISEFGINTLATPRKLLSTAAILKTGRYMAPEIYRSELELDHRTDQFAIGTVWSELLLAGGADPAQRVLKHQRQVIARLTAVNPSDRFPSFDTLLETIRDRQALSLIMESTREWPQRVRRIFTPVLSLIALGSAALFYANSIRESGVENTRVLQSQSELRQRIREVEHSRMSLLAEGFLMPEVSDALVRYFSADTEYEILESLSEGTATDENFGSSMKTRLNAREASIELAHGTIRRLGEIEGGLQALGRVSDRTSKNHDGIPLPMQSLLNRAIEEFQSGQFHASLEISEQLVAKIGQFFDDNWKTALAKAEENKSQWRTALIEHGIPYSEPNKNLTGILLQIGFSNIASTTADAIIRAREVSETFRAWTTELEQLPRQRPGSFRNSLGMLFETVGSIQVSVWETRILDFHAYVEATGFDANRAWREEAALVGPTHPVTSVARIDGVTFCDWLTGKEHAMGMLPKHLAYSLPTDLEWSMFAGLENERGVQPFQRSFEAPSLYPWESDDLVYSNHGNYFTPSSANESNHFFAMKDRFTTTAPVGRFAPNRNGLHDLGGNVWEWVSTPYFEEPAVRYKGSYMARGGGWRTINLEQMKTGYRINPPAGHQEIGFRCIIRSKSRATEKPDNPQ
ncbi:MAG: SUMF1/EgtB/PvdO family nonheme iron enzyme [Verrucomicrobia bacterium]|nr:SUMF1/EgtB/PvdO family nonheme iron enzyme [Verrucomicrobiota bacterium]